jgi:DMSO/TMAO reductase YedYZ molybdopterin-dependent catalytic subunit
MTLHTLPPGQFELPTFPRFGLPQFAFRIPPASSEVALSLSGDAAEAAQVAWQQLQQLPRIEQTSDFHCVTTWSRSNLRWSGFRFSDFYETLLVPAIRPDPSVQVVVLRGLDGYSTSLPLEDALTPDVLLADTLNDQPLSLEHGAPLRFVAPAHYGYKNPKHVCAIEVWRDYRHFRSSALPFMDHPRARVAHEEHGRGVVGWLLRYLYRPWIGLDIWLFERGFARHRS